VAIQGEHGSFSEDAVGKLLNWPHRVFPAVDFPTMFAAVGRHEAHACLTPMENSLVGSIFESYDLLLQFGYRIMGEVYLRVEHCLIAPVGTYLEDIQRVYSHPVALEQCRLFFRAHPRIQTVATYDTAGSVRMLVLRHEVDAGAIAGRGAASHYGAKVLAENVEDDPANYTRFFLLAPADEELEGIEDRFRPEGIGPIKTSIVFHVANEPGSLHGALSGFAEEGVDLAKIESRPVRGRPFEYIFYADFFGHPAVDPGRKALRALSRQAGFLRILGTYPAGRLDWMGTDAPLLPAGERPTE
jgi:prephenate dehydratase